MGCTTRRVRYSPYDRCRRTPSELIHPYLGLIVAELLFNDGFIVDLDSQDVLISDVVFQRPRVGQIVFLLE